MSVLLFAGALQLEAARRPQPTAAAPTLRADATVASEFHRIERLWKGPFGRNHLEDLGFQGAFRNRDAQILASVLDFYTGNQFDTNYYEIVGRFVYNIQDSPERFHSATNDSDHQRLFANREAAMPVAASMIRHSVLEYYYLHYFPNSKWAAFFNTYGVGGSEFEEQYARYLFNFYFSAADDYQYLPAFLLIKTSPIGSGSTVDLEKARELMKNLPNIMQHSDRAYDEIVQLRNAVHNRLSRDVIDQLDRFIANNKSSSYVPTLRQVRKIIWDYYAYGADNIQAQAAKIGQRDFAIVASTILKQKSATVQDLLTMSQLGADLRTNLLTKVSYNSRADNMVLLTRVSQYLNSRTIGLKDIDSPLIAQVILNTIYIEGYLTKKHLDFLMPTVVAAPDTKTAIAALAKIPAFAQANLVKAFTPALGQWTTVEPGMAFFTDNTIKSSSLNTLSVISARIGN